MMKKLFRIFTIVLTGAFAISMTACNNGGNDDTSTLYTDAPAEIVFNADGTGGKDVIIITTNSDSWNYSLTPADGWLSASASGNVLSLTALPNTSQDVRPDIELKITAGNATPVIITVKQLQYMPFPEVAFNVEGLTGEVEVLYTDGTTETATVEDGNLSLFGASPKVVYSISNTATGEVLIGRMLGDIIKLKFAEGRVVFRPAADNKIPVGTYAELALINDALDGDYLQEADIDMLGAEVLAINGLERQNWTPIGEYIFDPEISTPFTGSYDGADFKLHNLYISMPETSMAAIGVFASANGGAELLNIHVDSGSVAGKYYAAGAVVGFCSSEATIRNCSNGASVAGDEAFTNGAVGGVVGYANAATVIIENCSNSGLISGPGIVGGVIGVSRSIVKSSCNTAKITGFGGGTMNYVGGVVGQHSTGALLESSYNTGEISGTNRTGGVCGYNNGGAVKSSYNTGEVSASGPSLRTGGIAGENAGVGAATNGVLTGNYNTGSVTSVGQTYSYAGGICGYNGSSRNITSCYNTGSVSSSGATNNDAGGICGQNYMSAIISACYSTGVVSASDNTANAGGVCGYSMMGRVNSSYWLKRGEEAGVGTNLSGTDGSAAFSDSSWPSSGDAGWAIDAAGWKSLGLWIAGGSPDGANSDFPKLYWE